MVFRTVISTLCLEPILSKTELIILVEDSYEHINITIEVIKALDLNNSSHDMWVRVYA